MITCPVCKHTEMVGALFCGNCGARLTPTGSVTLSAPPRRSAGRENLSAGSPFSASASVSLYLLGSEQTFQLVGQDEFTLGRMTDGQVISPDIDLSPYLAFEAGVSRLHASLRILDGHVMIVDHGSVNGTHVNDVKILANQPHPLSNGDVILLGKLAIQVLIHEDEAQEVPSSQKAP